MWGGTPGCTAVGLVYTRRVVTHTVRDGASRWREPGCDWLIGPPLGFVVPLTGGGDLVPPLLGEARGRMTRGGSPGGAEDRKFKHRGPKSKIPGRKSLLEVGVPGAKRMVSRTSAVGPTRSTSIARTRDPHQLHQPAAPPGEKGKCRKFDSVYEHGTNPGLVLPPCKPLIEETIADCR